MQQTALRRKRNASDASRTLVLLSWVAFASSAFYYIFDRPPLPEGAPPQSQAAHRPTKDNDALYTGSILLVETRDRCWLRTIDNRNGSMWDKGYVDCDAFAAATLAPSKQNGVGSIQRMQSISNAFRSGS